MFFSILENRYIAHKPTLEGFENWFDRLEFVDLIKGCRMMEQFCPYDFSDARSCPDKVENTWFSAWLLGHYAKLIFNFAELVRKLKFEKST